MGYTKYIAEQGDCISSIAFAHGFFPDTLWDDPKNSKLKQDRKDPNVLKPGDEVYIRDKEEKQESCGTEQKHRFCRKGVPEKLVVQFLLSDEPRASEACVVDIDGTLSEVQTDPDGKLSISIPPNAGCGKVAFRKSGDTYELNLGHLDPMTEISGVQGRLRNLGFYTGPIDGILDSQTTKAIQVFQSENGLDPTGALDGPTTEKLEAAHRDEGPAT